MQNSIPKWFIGLASANSILRLGEQQCILSQSSTDESIFVSVVCQHFVQYLMDKDRKKELKAAINIISMMPPSKMRKNQVGLINLAPSLEDTLLDKIQLPHALELDTTVNQYFLQTQFNRDGDQYRSPYSNTYFPPTTAETAYIPIPGLRDFEVKGNQLFQQYTKLYYEGGIGNFFVSESQQGFACGFFAKKQVNNGELTGSWDSFNVVDLKVDDSSKKVTYKLNTTVLVEMKISNEKVGDVDLSGYMKKNKQQAHRLPQKNIQQFHLSVIGRLVEDMQSHMRQQLDSIYISKTKMIAFTTRYPQTKALEEHKSKLAAELINLKSKNSSE